MVGVWLRDLTRATSSGYAGYADLDKALLNYLDLTEPQFFVEVGGSNGVSMSNTWFLEKDLKWSGVLIEADPLQCRLARLVRTAQVVNAALVPSKYESTAIFFYQSGLSGSLLARPSEELYESTGFKRKQIEVPTITIKDTLSDFSQIQERFELLVMDMEGFEIEILRDVSNWGIWPRLICLETVFFDLEEVTEALDEVYDFVAWLTPQDTLWRLKTAG
jgi:FkbM family methyltransferase